MEMTECQVETRKREHQALIGRGEWMKRMLRLKLRHKRDMHMMMGTEELID